MEKTYLINTLFFKREIFMQNVMKKILCTGLALLLVCPNNIAQASSVSIEENRTVSLPNEVMQSDAGFFEKKIYIIWMQVMYVKTKKYRKKSI